VIPQPGGEPHAAVAAAAGAGRAPGAVEEGEHRPDGCDQDETEQRFTIEEAVARAQVAHRRGQLDVAERIYRAVLELRPDEVDALHFLGVLMHQRGHSADAVDLIRRAIALAPAAPGPWNNLGNVLLESARTDEAVEAYRACLALRPDFAEAHNNLGTIHRSRGEWALAEAAYQRALEAASEEAGGAAADGSTTSIYPVTADAYNNLASLMLAQHRHREAVGYACRAIIVSPGHASARKLLGLAHYMLGELDKAAAVYRDWLAEEPGNPVALHHLAACTGEAVPSRAADAYVEATFDAFAASFDARLEHLHYRAPQLIADALASVRGAPMANLDILDAGCGTGLCGPLVRPWARSLSGVDLSAQMLQRAAQRGAYDHLHKAELTAWLGDHRAQWDVVLSADTLCYFGDLGDVLAAAQGALRAGGWLLFTVEALLEDGAEATLRLRPHGRYVHGRAHVVAALSAAGFEAPSIAQQALRNEGGEPVAGWLVCARKP
jgi:predicted TPR repeat methyltransferase